MIGDDEGLESDTTKTRSPPSEMVASPTVTDGAGSSSMIVPAPVSEMSPTLPPDVDEIESVNVSPGSSMVSSIEATVTVPDVSPDAIVTEYGPAA